MLYRLSSTEVTMSRTKVVLMAALSAAVSLMGGQ